MAGMILNKIRTLSPVSLKQMENFVLTSMVHDSKVVEL